MAEREGLWLARAQVARGTTFFSYSWTGTTLDDMLGAIEDTAARNERDAEQRYLWIGACASLLSL